MFCLALMMVCAVAEVHSTVEGCVNVLGVVVFLLVRRYKHTEGDVALNPAACDAQCTFTYSASRL